MAALLLGAALAEACVAPAAAVPTKQDGGFIGGPRGVSTGGLFTEPSDVAVYRGGAGGGRKLFVVEAAGESNGRVQRLDGHGNFELAWGRDVIRSGARGDTGGGFEICRAEVSGAPGCKAGPVGARAGELRMPTAVAVSEATGDVYVMDQGNRRVQRFRFDGRFTDAWGWGVATGAPKVEVCRTHCRAGRTGGREGDGNPGQLAGARTGAIAVNPRAPHHVFLGDEGNSRVLEFTATGKFVRGWGWGVATGSRRFETCTDASGCLAGAPRPGGAWPRHLDVDSDGIVYGSERALDSAVVRFASARPSRSGDAADTLLAPLTAPDVLTDGYTLGLAVDPATGTLAVARDPFGPMVVDQISAPGARLGPADARPEAVAQEGLSYLGSVNGIAAAEGTVYVAKSTRLNPNDPVAGASACGPVARPRACNGLALLSPGGTAEATATSAVTSGRSAVALSAAVAARGVVRYRVQASRNGRAWRSLGKSRYLLGDGYTYVTATGDGLRPGTAYQVRLLLAREGGRSEVIVSNRLLVATDGEEGPRGAGPLLCCGRAPG